MHEILSTLISSQSYLNYFISSFFFGELTVIAGAFLATKGTFNIGILFLLAFSSTVLFDTFFFFAGRYFFEKSVFLINYKKKNSALFSSLDQITGKNPFSILIYNKFLFGTRIASTLLLSLREISFKKFLICESTGAIVWLVAIIPLGWFAGKGIGRIESLTHKIEVIATLCVLFIIISKLLKNHFMSKK